MARKAEFTEFLSLMVSQEMRGTLDAMAEKAELSLSDVVRQCIAAGIEVVESEVSDL